MKKSILLIFWILCVGMVSAQQKVISLYTGAAPGSESWNWNEATNDQNVWKLPVVYNVSKPTLTVFAPEAGKSNGTSVIICPGGGFQFLAINKEGYDVAKWLVKKGVTCFVLKYRVAHTVSEDPVAEFQAKLGKKEFQDENVPVITLAVADGKAAIEYVRKRAMEFKIEPDRIGIMGFSAGGTVAASALYNYTPENRPDFGAPIYPFFPSTMHGTVGSDAPPLFIATASDDNLGLAPHSVDLYSQWLSTKHDAELHMYARGSHGFGMDVQNIPTDKWIERFSEWLDVHGFMKKK